MEFCRRLRFAIAVDQYGGACNIHDDCVKEEMEAGAILYHCWRDGCRWCMKSLAVHPVD